MNMRKPPILLTLCLAVLVFTACGKTKDPILGRWQAVDGKGWSEYFEDGTAIFNDGSVSLSGTWKRLDDGRLKVDATVMGSNTTEVFFVSITGEKAIFTSSAGKAETYQRASVLAAQPAEPQAPAAAGGVVGAVKDMAQEMTGQGQRQRDVEAQKRTVADVRNLGTAMFSWLTDQVGAAAAGQTQSVSMEKYLRISRADLTTLLVPQYLEAVPELDGWGHPYELYLNVENPLAQQVMSIRSPGRDGSFSTTDYTVGSFPEDDFDKDIIWADGFFVRWPAKPGS